MTPRTWIVAVYGFVLGSLLGMSVAFIFGSSSFDSMSGQANFLKAAADVRTTMRALTLLKADDSELLAQHLELQLSHKLADLSLYGREIVIDDCDPGISEILSSARGYRAARAGPALPSPTKELVSEALSLCEK
jgi:hypothetical protein